MRSHSWVLALALALATACSSRKEAPVSGAGSASATSQDGTLAYAVDADADLLTVVQRKTRRKIAEIRVGKAPEQLAVGPDETIYVANRGSRSISIIRRNDWKEAGRINAGLEPMAVAVAPDNQTLYVVNGSSLDKADAGTLMAIDLTTRRVRWELSVAGEPRGIALVDASTARIELYRRAEPLLVNLNVPKILGLAPASPGATEDLDSSAARPFPALHGALVR
jgi:YVTN family beta-propeller protein